MNLSDVCSDVGSCLISGAMVLILTGHSLSKHLTEGRMCSNEYLSYLPIKKNVQRPLLYE